MVLKPLTTPPQKEYAQFREMCTDEATVVNANNKTRLGYREYANQRGESCGRGVDKINRH
jgi:hypothetical protein